MIVLPETGFLRESQLITQHEITPEKAAANKAAGRRFIRPRKASQGIFPFSHATLWRLVRAGRFPQPVKLSNRVTAWRAEDIRAHIQGV